MNKAYEAESCKMTSRTFQFPDGPLKIECGQVETQPVITCEFGTSKNHIPYSTFQERNKAFEAFDRRNAAALVRMLQTATSNY